VHAYARSQAHDTNTSARADEAEFIKLEAVVPGALADPVTEAIRQAARTGRPGDGMIFVTEVQRAVRIRSGDRDLAAL
jgi:nitrogen regulatory protein PII